MGRLINLTILRAMRYYLLNSRVSSKNVHWSIYLLFYICQDLIHGGASDLRVTENEGQVQGEGKNYNNWYSGQGLYQVILLQW